MMKVKEKFKKMFEPFVKNADKSRFSNKGLVEFDFWFLKYILVKKQNELNVVLKNEQFYSKRTLSAYKRMYESANRLLEAMKMTYHDGFDEEEIPTSW